MIVIRSCATTRAFGFINFIDSTLCPYNCFRLYRKFSKNSAPLFIRRPYSNSEIISSNKKFGTFAIFAMDADNDESVRVV